MPSRLLPSSVENDHAEETLNALRAINRAACAVAEELRVSDMVGI